MVTSRFTQSIGEAQQDYKTETRMERVRSRLLAWAPLGLLLAIALLRGLAYANLMPPWAIIDEEQHLHYVQVLSEQRRRPDPQQDYLSPELVASLFETHRWETYGFGARSITDPQQMGLEGHSYEGYQPPLYYLLMVPAYRLAGGLMLEKLFVLRWATVALSTLTVVFTYLLSRKITGSRATAFLITAILILIPERTVAVSRVNNDVLLEVFSASFLWLAIQTLLDGPSDRRSIFLGVLLGLGTLSKMPMVIMAAALPWIFIVHRQRYTFWRGIFISTGLAAVFIVPLLASNIVSFGDLTGFAAVAPILNFSAPAFSFIGLIRSILESFLNLWVILWQGARASINPTITVVFGVLFVIVAVSVYGLAHQFRRAPGDEAARSQRSGSSLLAMLVGIFGCFTLYSYWTGQVPVIQGRFLLPVISALAVLLGSGLQRAPRPVLAMLLLVLVLVVMDGYSLFIHLLPQYYPLIACGPDQTKAVLKCLVDLRGFAEHVGLYKPAVVQHMLRATIVGYLIAQPVAVLSVIRSAVTTRNLDGNLPRVDR